VLSSSLEGRKIAQSVPEVAHTGCLEVEQAGLYAFSLRIWYIRSLSLQETVTHVVTAPEAGDKNRQENQEQIHSGWPSSNMVFETSGAAGYGWKNADGPVAQSKWRPSGIGTTVSLCDSRRDYRQA
jgi:hypothetical protein